MSKARKVKGKSLIKDGPSNSPTMSEENIRHTDSRERTFYEQMKLPPEANVLQFFDKVEADFDVKLVLLDIFIKEHRADFRKFEKARTSLPDTVRAYNAYLWLRNLPSSRMLQYRVVSDERLRSVHRYMNKLEDSLVGRR